MNTNSITKLRFINSNLGSINKNAQLKMNSCKCRLLLLTDMQGGNNYAEQETHARKLKLKHSYKFRSTTPDLAYSNENTCTHLEIKSDN